MTKDDTVLVAALCIGSGLLGFYVGQPKSNATNQWDYLMTAPVIQRLKRPIKMWCKDYYCHYGLPDNPEGITGILVDAHGIARFEGTFGLVTRPRGFKEY
jgi:hypothetical protein